MSRLEERIHQEMEEIEKAARRRVMRQLHTEDQKTDTTTRRAVIIGNYILDQFPEYASIKPGETEEENDKEFAMLIRLIAQMRDCMDRAKD